MKVSNTLTVLFCSLLFSALASAANPRPNIIFIITDDIGWTDWRVYNSEGLIPSPTIDKLANEGIRFTDAHSSSALCAPSRYSLLTGNYPWRGLKPGGSWMWFKNPQILSTQQTIGHVLQKAGYVTAIIGKLHIGGEFEWTADRHIDFTQPMKVGPREWGFDYSFTLQAGHQSPPYLFFENNRVYGDPTKIVDFPLIHSETGVTQQPGPGLPGWNPKKVANQLLIKTQQFINSTGEQPFYIHFSTPAAHWPYDSPDTLLGARIAGKTGVSARADMIYSVDVILNKLLKTLRDSGKLNNTLIVLTSDNGGTNDDRPLGHDANRGLLAEKSFIGEGGHRVPLIAWWPNHIPPGQVQSALVGTQDMAATFAAIAGAPYVPTQLLDSIDLTPLLLGQQPAEKPLRDALLIDAGLGRDAFDTGQPTWQQQTDAHTDPAAWKRQFIRWVRNCHHRLFGKPQDRMLFDEEKADSDFWINQADQGSNDGSQGMAHALRMGPWKLVFDIEHDAPVALYNLDHDLSEKTNLIDAPNQKTRIQTMEQRYRELRSSARSTPWGGNNNSP